MLIIKKIDDGFTSVEKDYANYFSKEEIQNLELALSNVKRAMSNSVLYKYANVDKQLANIIKHVKNECFDKNKTLKPELIKNILEAYKEQIDFNNKDIDINFTVQTINIEDKKCK